MIGRNNRYFVILREGGRKKKKENLPQTRDCSVLHGASIKADKETLCIVIIAAFPARREFFPGRRSSPSGKKALQVRRRPGASFDLVNIVSCLVKPRQGTGPEGKM